MNKKDLFYSDLINYFDSLVNQPFPLTVSDIVQLHIKPNAYDKYVLGVITIEQLTFIRNRYNY